MLGVHALGGSRTAHQQLVLYLGRHFHRRHGHQAHAQFHALLHGPGLSAGLLSAERRARQSQPVAGAHGFHGHARGKR